MLSILGIGYSQPSNIVDNVFLEKLDVGTNESWILEKIGIVSRLTSLPIDYISKGRNQDPFQAIKVASTTPTALGIDAARKALAISGIDASQIGLLICDCCAPNSIVPTEGQLIARELGVSGQVYDVFTACPAFALHIDFVRNFKQECLPDYILCVTTGTVTQHVNYNDRSDGAIWGDGAAAWVVSSKKNGKLNILESFFWADPTRCDAVVIDRYGHFHQDGRAVRDFSVRQTVRLIKEIESRLDIDWNRDVFIGHQANATMLRQITNNRGIPESNHWHNVTSVGNQAGAGAPASLALHWDEIQPKQKVIIAVVGAGLSWGSVVLEGADL